MAATLSIVFAFAVIAVGGRLVYQPMLSRFPIPRTLASVLVALAGLYLVSVLYFFSLGSFGASRFGLAAAEVLAIALILVGVIGLRNRQSRSSSAVADNFLPTTVSGWPGRVALLFAGGLICAYTAGFVIRSVKAPHGYIDAVITWNRGARFLFRDKEHWLNNFEVLVGQFQPDYPLFLQSTIARLWTYLGSESQAVPPLVAYGFVALSAALLYTSLAHLRGRAAAAFALCLLVGSTIFVKSSFDQVADVPIATFILASIVVLSLGERHGLNTLSRWALAGAFAGAAAWMKNEGGLFVMALGAAAVLGAGRPWFRQETLRRVLGYGLGAVITLIPVLVLKLWYAPPSYLADGGLDAVIVRLTDGSRYLEVLGLMVAHVVRLDTLPIPVLALLALLGGFERAIAHREAVMAGVMTVAFLMIGYYLFYMVTPFTVAWHVDTSFTRLLTQLLPVGLFLFFSSVRVPHTFAGGERKTA